MPWIQSQTILYLVAALRNGSSLVAPVYRGHRGDPVGFDIKKWREQLRALTGEQGARDLIAENNAEMTPYEATDAGVVLDVDRSADLRNSS